MMDMAKYVQNELSNVHIEEPTSRNSSPCYLK